jgi:MFS transporter, AAHS family, 2,5-dihydroxybenzoate transporter
VSELHRETKDFRDADAVGDGSSHSRATVRAVLALLTYQGYAFSILGVSAPFIAKGFALDQSAIARMFAWISVNAFGALFLSRMADRIGRRRVLLISLVITPVCSAGAALSGNISWFIFFEILAYAAVGATFAGAFVMLAEALPTAYRAKGQGYALLAISTGGGLCVILAPILQHFGWSWRWLLGVPAAGIFLLPMLIRAIPESERWQRAVATGATQESHFYDVFNATWRRRTIPLILATLLGEFAGAGIAAWPFYHATTEVGLSSAKTSLVMLVGGTIGIAGLAIGAWASERYGRIRSIVVLGLATIVGALAYYWGPPKHFSSPVLWLIVAQTWLSAVGRGTVVAANSAATELLPTALRGTIMGWIALCVAFAAVGAQVTIAVLAKPLGGLSNVVGWLSLLLIPAAIVWYFFIDETRGLSLESASGEEERKVAVS